MTHVVAALLVGASGWALAVGTPAVLDEGEEPAPEVVHVAVDRAYQGHGVRWWARRAVQARKDANARGRTIRRLRRVLAHDPQVREAINLAAVAYNVDGRTLWRKADCETGGTFSPRAYNASSSASGLLQFLPSTWQTTPYARFSVWSPYANALAAGWMHARGRGGEWECR